MVMRGRIVTQPLLVSLNIATHVRITLVCRRLR
jgi:hypothetical protein